MSTINLQNIDEKSLQDEFLKYIDNKSDIAKLIDFLDDNTRDINKDEQFMKNMQFPSTPPGMMSFLVPTTKYYLNIKLTSIALFALLFDLTLTKGFASLFTRLFGKTGQSIVKLLDHEKCIVLESYRNKLHQLNKNAFSVNQECFNNDLKCKYHSSDDRCSLTTNEVDRIADELLKKNVYELCNGVFKLSI
jgi:hypothetical protein